MSDFEFEGELKDLSVALRPTAHEADRILSQVRRKARHPHLGGWWRWLGGWWRWAAAVGLLLALGSVARFAFSERDPHVLTSHPVTVRPGIQLHPQGQGIAEVKGDQTKVDWEEGTVQVDVAPREGHHLTVNTPEAQIDVVGTSFAVERGPFGTAVLVHRGEVVIQCQPVGQPQSVVAGGAVHCVRNAGAGLGRLLWLEGEGASAEERLNAVDQALAHPSAVPATVELLNERRVGLLADLGRVQDAIKASRALPTPRRLALLSSFASEALDTTGCGAAEPWLAALAKDEDVTAILLIVQCLASRDRASARSRLDALATLDLTPDQQLARDAWSKILEE